MYMLYVIKYTIRIILSKDLIQVIEKRFCEFENIVEADCAKWSNSWIVKFKHYNKLWQRQFYGKLNLIKLVKHIDQINEINVTSTCDNHFENNSSNYNKTKLFYHMLLSIGLAWQEAYRSKEDKTRLTYNFCINTSDINM